jgi:hypothetical protein
MTISPARIAPSQIKSAQTRVLAAQAELDAAHDALAQSAAPLEASIKRRKTTWILAGGFVGGLALSLLPTRLWARIGAIAGGGAAFAARSMLTPIIAGALMSRTQQAATPSTETESV